jgi:hypothetical protein
LGIAGLAVFLFTMPGTSSKGSHQTMGQPESSVPVAIASASAANATQPGASAGTSAGESLLPASFSKSVTVVAGVLLLFPFAASTFQVLRRNRTV